MSALAMTRSSRSAFASISVFNSFKRGNVITCLWTPSNRNREGWLLNAEVEYLLLYLEGSRGGGGGSEGGGERFNYVCTSTTTESADSRAQHAHSTAKSRTTSSGPWACRAGGLIGLSNFQQICPMTCSLSVSPPPCQVITLLMSQKKYSALITLSPAACRRNAGIAGLQTL